MCLEDDVLKDTNKRPGKEVTEARSGQHGPPGVGVHCPPCLGACTCSAVQELSSAFPLGLYGDLVIEAWTTMEKWE